MLSLFEKTKEICRELDSSQLSAMPANERLEMEYMCRRTPFAEKTREDGGPIGAI
jgi:hypothetical protein